MADCSGATAFGLLATALFRQAFLVTAGCSASFLIAAQRFFCAAAMRFRALALMCRLGFAVTACAVSELCLIFFQRSF